MLLTNAKDRRFRGARLAKYRRDGYSLFTLRLCRSGFGLELPQKGGERVHGKVGRMAGGFGQSSYFLQQLFRFNGASGLHTFA